MTTLATSLLHLSPFAESADERALLVDVAAKLRARDQEILHRVLVDLVPEVRRWMYFQLGPDRELDDASQDALAEIASALHRFEGRSSLLTLAHRITVRTSYRYFRRAFVAAPPEPAVDDNVNERVAARRALRKVHAALAMLPERRRAAFVLCVIEEVAPSEAARILGISPNAMRSLLSRARTDLEAALAAIEGEAAR